MTWITKLLQETVDPWTIQEPSMTKDEIIESMMEEQGENRAVFIGSKDANTVLYIRKSTHIVADVHLFSKNDNPWQVVRAIKRIQSWVLDNTDFSRLEMRTHKEDVCKLAERCGWSREGSHPEAVKTAEGVYLTEYSYGLLKQL